MDIFSDSKMQERFVESALQKYYKYKAMESVGDSLIDRFMPSKDKKLERTERELSIMQKKRQLGLPESGADYEYATNENKPFYTQTLNSLGKRVLEAVPGPGTFGTLGKGLKPFFGIAEAIAPELPSLKHSVRLGGNRYARLFGGAASAAFSR